MSQEKAMGKTCHRRLWPTAPHTVWLPMQRIRCFDSWPILTSYQIKTPAANIKLLGHGWLQVELDPVLAPTRADKIAGDLKTSC